jgi:hypothetical protein
MYWIHNRQESIMYVSRDGDCMVQFFLWFSTVVYEFQAKHTSFAILLNIGALVLNEEEHQHGVWHDLLASILHPWIMDATARFYLGESLVIPFISAKIRDEMSKFSKSPERSRPNPRIYSHWKSLGKSRWFQQIHDNKTIFGSKKNAV